MSNDQKHEENFSDTERKLRARIRELQDEVARLSDGAQGVGVKPLEWDEGGNGAWATPDGYYQIRFLDGSFMLLRPFLANEIYRTLEAAKAAAQADYERRILSALTPTPVTVGALEPVERALRHLKGCLTFPVSSEINPRGYDTRTPTPETVEYMVELVMEADAALRALSGEEE